MDKNVKTGPVSTDEARAILGADQFRQGGGWGKLGGKDVYLCTGAHKDGSSGWAILQIGRSF